ncbi:response regulator [Maricaulis parjimensis]|uniref:response regulator n=1 Tax=Maricaulis parjimensis TaxID=144023 RepID=UPI00193A9D33|nr:response regulator [Maricaulis parjimensis]
MSEAVDTNRPDVLVVDDDPVNREIFRWALEPLCNLSERPNGVGVAEYICEARPAIVFLDLMMPIVDGAEVIDGVRALCPQMVSRIVLVTAATEHPKAVAISQAGDIPVHVRPFEDEKIVGLLQTYIQ